MKHQYSEVPQKGKAPSVDYLEAQYLVELQIAETMGVFGIKTRTSDCHFGFDLRIPAGGRAFFTCSSSNNLQASVTLYSHA